MDELVKALRAGEQADMDGTLVKVSRQACEEAADAIEALQAQLAEARDKALEDVAKEADERVKAWLEAEPPYDGSLEEIIERIAGLPAAIRDMKEG